MVNLLKVSWATGKIGTRLAWGPSKLPAYGHTWAQSLIGSKWWNLQTMQGQLEDKSEMGWKLSNMLDLKIFQLNLLFLFK